MSNPFDKVIQKMNYREDIAAHNSYVKTEEINKFIQNNKNDVPNADSIVLEFIGDFLYRGSPDVLIEDSVESVRSTFRAGYCYYFAEMLKLAFNRGCVCWAAPFSHIVWCDINGVAYDIEGVYFGEADYLIPVEYIKDSLWSFKHIPNETGIIRDTDFIIKEFEQDLNNGILEYKGLLYVNKGYF